MKFGSVCSGIEAASVAWYPLGWKAAWLAEIEAFPSAVLAYHYPDVPNLGDMTKIVDKLKAGEIEAPDVFVGGTPCQAFSVAGLRGGLADPRGGLTLEFVRIANAIDDILLSDGREPAVIVWENVPGVLSSKDNAFGCFLGALAGEECELTAPGGKWTDSGCVYGPQRSIAWRVLDAQYFGVAQRRRRVFVVASAGDFDASEILFEFDGVRRDTPPSREAWKGFAGDVATCFEPRSPDGHARIIGDICPTLNTMSGGQREPCVYREGNFGQYNDDGTFATVKASGGCLGGGSESFVEFHPTQDPISSIDGTTHALGCGSSNGQSSIAVAIPIHDKATRHSGEKGCSNGFGVGTPTDPCPTLDTGCNHAVAFAENSRSEVRLEGGDGSRTGALSTGGGKAGQGVPMIATTMQVRRLTPIECERLQSFPDDYTKILWRKKLAEDCPDGPRYKALGNSMNTKVMRWIGERINKKLSAV